MDVEFIDCLKLLLILWLKRNLSILFEPNNSLLDFGQSHKVKNLLVNKCLFLCISCMKFEGDNTIGKSFYRIFGFSKRNREKPRMSNIFWPNKIFFSLYLFLNNYNFLYLPRLFTGNFETFKIGRLNKLYIESFFKYSDTLLSNS